MEGLAKLFGLLVAQPLVVTTGLLLFGLVVFVAQPMWRIASKRLEQRLEGDWEAGTIGSTWHRVEAFVLIVHCGLAALAAVWCAFATNYPAPGIGPAVQHPFGPELMRIWAYSLSVAGGCMALGAVLLRSEGIPPVADRSLFRHLPRAMIVGLAASVIYLAYAELADRTLLGGDDVPAEALRSIPWLYCWLAFLSISMAIFVYIPLLVLRGLWRLTASLP